MKKVLTSLLLLTQISAFARTVLTTIPALRLPRGYGHALVDYDLFDSKECRGLRLWTGFDYYEANQAYGTKDGREKVPLSALLFNSSEFYFSDSFVDPTIPAQGNVLTMLAKITPKIAIDKTSFTFGMEAKLWSDECSCWYGGVRAMLPYSITKVALEDCCNLSDIDSTDDIKGRLFMCDEETVSTNGIPAGTTELTAQNVCVYRMDLVRALTENIDHIPLLEMNQTAPSGPTLEIGGTDISEMGTLNSSPPGTPGVYSSNPVHMLVSLDGNLPTRPWSVYVAGAANNPVGSTTDIPGGFPYLDADGSNATTNGQRLRVLAGRDYTPLLNNPSNLRKLFLVPAVVPETIPPIVPAQALVGSGARTVSTILNNVINDTSFSIAEFLNQAQLNFCPRRVTGLGDLDLQLYFGRYWCDCVLRTEGWFGMSFPTYSRIDNPHNLLQVTPGNDRHIEVKLGGELQWDATDWFYLRTEAQFNAAIKNREHINASFAGATVANLGPVVDADVSWRYFNGSIHGTFLLPCEYNSGMDIAYELYAKPKDHIKFFQTTATDYAGQTGELSESLAKARSNRIAHNIRVEMYYTFMNVNITAGFLHTVGGKNVPVATNMFLMMTLAY